MSHFYANIQGNRGGTSRGGSKKSGIHGHIRGWRIGVKVNGYHEEKDDIDEFHITITNGSGYSKPKGKIKLFINNEAVYTKKLA